MVTGDKQWNPCTMWGRVLMALHGDFPAAGCVTSTFLYKCWSWSRHWTFKNNKNRRSSEMHKTSESQATEQHGAQRAVRPICWDLSMSLISQPHGERRSREIKRYIPTMDSHGPSNLCILKFFYCLLFICSVCIHCLCSFFFHSMTASLPHQSALSSAYDHKEKNKNRKKSSNRPGSSTCWKCAATHRTFGSDVRWWWLV